MESLDHFRTCVLGISVLFESWKKYCSSSSLPESAEGWRLRIRVRIWGYFGLGLATGSGRQMPSDMRFGLRGRWLGSSRDEWGLRASSLERVMGDLVSRFSKGIFGVLIWLIGFKNLLTKSPDPPSIAPSQPYLGS